MSTNLSHQLSQSGRLDVLRVGHLAAAGFRYPAERVGIFFDNVGQIEKRQCRQHQSTGPGLTFCKLAVAAHGGRIGVSGATAEGSTFWLTLPTS